MRPPYRIESIEQTSPITPISAYHAPLHRPPAWRRNAPCDRRKLSGFRRATSDLACSTAFPDSSSGRVARRSVRPGGHPHDRVMISPTGSLQESPGTTGKVLAPAGSRSIAQRSDEGDERCAARLRTSASWRLALGSMTMLLAGRVSTHLLFVRRCTAASATPPNTARAPRISADERVHGRARRLLPRIGTRSACTGRPRSEHDPPAFSDASNQRAIEVTGCRSSQGRAADLTGDRVARG